MYNITLHIVTQHNNKTSHNKLNIMMQQNTLQFFKTHLNAFEQI